MALTKEHILAEIRRCAAENADRPLGVDRFLAETGIKESDWRGRFWARWNDAVAEAGLEPNQRNPARTDDDLLSRLAVFVRELGRFPVVSELRMRARTDRNFPQSKTYLTRFGNKDGVIAALRLFCEKRGETDILQFATIPAADQSDDETAEPAFGFVYLLKSGRFYKIGRSNAVGRRERELAIQPPEKASLIHSIKTDDPVGIEGYWHRRFEPKRQNGEWFALTAADVAAFRRRKFM